jgi:hypothetical protein
LILAIALRRYVIGVTVDTVAAVETPNLNSATRADAVAARRRAKQLGPRRSTRRELVLIESVEVGWRGDV